MKWLSVKEYHPVLNAPCLARWESGVIEMGIFYNDAPGVPVFKINERPDLYYGMRNFTHFTVIEPAPREHKTQSYSTGTMLLKDGCNNE
jgi:hypothetical protein